MPNQERSLDDLPLAAYGGSGMQEEPAPAADPDQAGQAGPDAATPAAAVAAAPPAAPTNLDLPVPEDEPSHGPSPARVVAGRVFQLFRTSRIAAGAGFAVVIVVGLVILSSGGANPGATAATPTKGPTAAPVVVAPSGDASLMLTGAVTGTFPLTGLAGGQKVDATTITGGWGDALQTSLSIAGPLDRGTRTTDERLVLTIEVLVNGQPVTFMANAGQCTIGMAQVGTKVQGSFTCHKLKSTDGKLTLEASGNYRT